MNPLKDRETIGSEPTAATSDSSVVIFSSTYIISACHRYFIMMRNINKSNCRVLKGMKLSVHVNFLPFCFLLNALGKSIANSFTKENLKIRL